jgi:four helix bundle protein
MLGKMNLRRCVMSTIKAFEEVQAWQKARLLADRIFKLTLEGSFARDFKLRDQINGSSGSVMDNIAEGFERNGNREFVQFLSIAKGSAGEVRSQLYRAMDRSHITKQEFENLKDEVAEVSRLIFGLMNYLGYVRSKYPKGARRNDQDPNFKL